MIHRHAPLGEGQAVSHKKKKTLVNKMMIFLSIWRSCEPINVSAMTQVRGHGPGVWGQGVAGSPKGWHFTLVNLSFIIFQGKKMDDPAAVNILQDQTHRLLASRPKCSSGVPRPHSNRKGLAKFGVHQHASKCWALSQNMKMSSSLLIPSPVQNFLLLSQVLL